MVNKSKAKGTNGETKVVRFLEAAGLTARRVVMKGSNDEGDVHIYDDHGCVSAVLEVKSGRQTQKISRLMRALWLAETQVETINSGSTRGYLVIAIHGSSIKDYHVWSIDGHSFWYLDQFADFVKGGF